MNLTGGLESLDPAFAKDLSTMWMAHMMYNTLVETDSNLNLKPSLAKRWYSSADGLTYTFILHNNVYFQNNALFKTTTGAGRRLTAQDVVFSFNRIIDPKTASPGAWIFNDRVATTKPFDAPNDTTLIIKLTKPFEPLPQILSMPYCSIVPEEVVTYYGKDFRSHPCGTGPFQLHLWDENNQLILHKNPNYWETDQRGTKLPYLKAIIVYFIDNKGSEFLQFLQGNLDFINGLDGSFKDLVLSKKGELKNDFKNKFRLQKRLYLNTEYLGFLLDSTLPASQVASTKNLLVRQAINYAIDREKIVSYFKNGIGIPAHGGFTPAGIPGFTQPTHYGYTYLPQKADSLLNVAGYPNGKGLKPVTIITPDNFSDIVNFVATQAAEVGIPITVEVMQPALVKQQISKSEAAFFRGQWIADYPDAETFLAVFYGKFPAPPNYTRFKNSQFDHWYDNSMSLPDTIRWQYYRRMDSLAISYAPVVPLYYDQMLHFTQKNVSGFSATPLNIIEMKYVHKE